MVSKKVCMLGSFSVGKTSLVRRFVERIFFADVYETTIGVKVDKKTVRVKEEDVALVLWDIHGDDVYQRIRMVNLRGMSGYLLVADGTRRQTLDDALALNDRVLQEMGKIPAVLVLNKSDLIADWEIDNDREAQLKGDGWTVFRTSAKTGDSVEQAYLHLAHFMLGNK
jgi:small GTP-binding protein